MNALSGFSSQQPGHEAAYAVDNSNGTWWEPAATDAQPTLTIELSPATRFDAVQLFTIDSVRLMFNGPRGFGGGRGRGGRGAGGAAAAGPEAAPAAAPAAGPAAAPAAEPPTTAAYQYKIEVSLDGQTYTTALEPDEERRLAKHDLRGNTPGEVSLRSTDHDELAPGHAAGDYRIHRIWKGSGIVACGEVDSRCALKGTRRPTKPRPHPACWMVNQVEQLKARDPQNPDPIQLAGW